MTSISVITPCLDAAGLLPEALASLAPQVTGEIEVILADGGSQDDSRAIAERSGFVRVLPEGDTSLYAGLARGVAAARGDYVLFLNADDRLGDGALAAYHAAAGRQPEVPLITGRILVEGNQKARLAPRGPLRPETALFGVPAINGRAFARHLFERFAFDPTVGLAADRKLMFDLAMAGISGVAIDHLVYRYRAHTGSRTLSADPASRRRAVEADVQLANRLASSLPTVPLVSAWHSLQALRARRWRISSTLGVAPQHLPTALTCWALERGRMAGY